MATKWINRGGGQEEAAEPGVLSNAPPRARLVDRRGTEVPRRAEKRKGAFLAGSTLAPPDPPGPVRTRSSSGPAPREASDVVTGTPRGTKRR